MRLSLTTGVETARENPTAVVTELQQLELCFKLIVVLTAAIEKNNFK